MNWVHHFVQSWLSLAYKNRGPMRLAAPILIPLSILYSGVNRVRRDLFSRGFLMGQQVNCPVLSIGNLTVGGVGKTPFCQFLVEHLRERGYKPGILIRGYKRKGEKPFLLTKQTYDVSQVEHCGDEAALLYLHTGVPIAVGRNRAESARTILTQTGCDVLLMDDGFQHLWLQRDLDLVMISKDQGIGNGYVLPYGPLREPVSALKAANAVIVNELTSAPDSSVSLKKNRCFARWAKVQQKINIPRFSGNLIWQSIQPLASWLKQSPDQLFPLSDFTAKAINLVSGIGSPERFENQAKAYGFRINWHFHFPDHHWFSPGRPATNKNNQSERPGFYDRKRCCPLIASSGAT